MNFISDNASGVSPEILQAIQAAAALSVKSYGADELTRKVEDSLRDIFETDLTALPVSTGTAANALGLSLLSPPWGSIYSHRTAHIFVDECGAPSFFAGGAVALAIDGDHGKLSEKALQEELERAGKGIAHRSQPSAVSMTQLSEAGTYYVADEIRAISDVARHFGMSLHMDGSRFANAVAAMNVSPASITWKVGVDVLSLGATKNGALAAEMVVIFDPSKADELAYRAKRSGHLSSKMKFFSAQIDAYLQGNLWIRNASHANKMAARLNAAINSLPAVRLIHPVQGNMVFLEVPQSVGEHLAELGVRFFYPILGNKRVIRFVTSFDTPEAEVDRLAQLIADHIRKAPSYD